MEAGTARYDDIADWYVELTRGWDADPGDLLPADVAGRRVLDLACGYGTVSRHLAGLGARVTGVDLSGAMIARARQLEAREGRGIDYVHADATGTGWWDGRPFDGVLCHMALMDIDDLAGAVATVAAVLRPGGWFSFSVLHPCYPGGPEGTWSGLSSWPPERGYACEGWWSTAGEGIRGHAGASHRRLSTYLNTVIAAGLAVEEVAEHGTSVPVRLLVRCRREVPSTEERT